MALSRLEAAKKLLRDKSSVGYIPLSTYGIDRYSHPWRAEDPSYHEVLEYTDRYDHIRAFFGAYHTTAGLGPVLQVEDPDVVKVQTYREGEALCTLRTLSTPQGDLSTLDKAFDDNKSSWRASYLIKRDEDIDAFLGTRFTPARPDVAAYRQMAEAMGDSGFPQIQIADPVCLVMGIMDYGDFMMRSLTIPKKLDALLEYAQELTITWLQGVVDAGILEGARIFGPEYCQPPMMRLEFYRRAVTELDRPIVKMIQDAGGTVQYHCHGPIAALLDDFLELGVDAIDPCEAPPNGDITLRELATRVGDAAVIMGNIQLDDLERATPDEIDRLVADAVDQVGNRAPFIVMPTADPMETPLPPQAARNIIQFIESARKYGGANHT